jgi:hypothetical protein
MKNQRPQVKDLQEWQTAILEHRRALLEAVIEQFPEVMKTKRTHVDVLRFKLSGKKTGDTSSQNVAGPI